MKYQYLKFMGTTSVEPVVILLCYGGLCGVSCGFDCPGLKDHRKFPSREKETSHQNFSESKRQIWLISSEFRLFCWFDWHLQVR